MKAYTPEGEEIDTRQWAARPVAQLQEAAK